MCSTLILVPRRWRHSVLMVPFPRLNGLSQATVKTVEEYSPYLPPANEVCEGYVFTGVCHSVHGGGRHARLLRGGGVCVVAPGWGACVVAPMVDPRGWGVGVHGCSGGGGMHGCSGGHAWLLWGGMHGCSRGAYMVFFDEIRSMSGRCASYWNAFLFSLSVGIDVNKLPVRNMSLILRNRFVPATCFRQ